MKKEAINTFGDGLIMDLHPLTTPNNVLTNCLNGTVITYNGNEFMLQNDMGNGEVHTAYLDKGYVPVGMKEHGGIIYVAAHNPISGKSQIGSFPSPQQLYGGDDLNVAPILLNFSDMITMKGAVPYIELEYFKKKLFQTNNLDEVKIFHPGDRFIIMCNSISSEIRQAINDNVLKLRLGIVNSSGNIDYIDEESLKIYKNGLWIYENSNTPLAEVIRSKELVQVFSGKSSGALILVIELKTFETFNLIRKYSCDENNVISIEFSGETTGVFTGTSKNDPDIVGILEANTATVQSTIVKSGTSGKQSYKILPACPYGVLERMAKNGVIDFSSIRTNSEMLGEWRFFVTDTYVKIGWGYDYYNLNEGSDIERIEFSFISATESANATNIDSIGNVYKYSITKEYYNGSFEEIIPFESGILKNWVYIVKIDRYVGGVKHTIGYRLLYTGSYFNDKFEDTPDFNTLPRAVESLKIKNSISANVTESSVDTFIKVHDSTKFVPSPTMRPEDFLRRLPTMETPANYRYNTKKVGKYDVTVYPAAGWDFDSRLYAGKPDPKIMDNFFKASPSASFGTPDNSDIAYSSSSYLSAEINTFDTPTSSITYNPVKKAFEGSITTNRNIISSSGPIKEKFVSSEKIEPMYTSNIDPKERVNLFSFREEGNVLYCVVGRNMNKGSTDSLSFYDSRIYHHAYTHGGDLGPIGGNGDDDGLNASLLAMGNGTIGIFGGSDGNYGRICMIDAPYSDTAWHRYERDNEHEIDKKDDYLIATWKDANGYHRIINLMSRKTESKDVKGKTSLIRVEMMLKCFLSQILVAKKVSETIYYIGPDGSNMVYHTSFNTNNTVKVDINNAGKNISVDFILGESSEFLETHINRWVSAVPGLVNFLPIFTASMPNTLEVPIAYGDNLTFNNDSNILNCYINAYSNFISVGDVKLTDYQRGRIFIGVTRGTANSDGTMNLETNPDGTYVIKPTGTTLSDWEGQPIALGYEINDRFITKYAKTGQSGVIPDGYYNEVYIVSYVRHYGDWLEGNDNPAPDLATDVGFGRKSIFKY